MFTFKCSFLYSNGLFLLFALHTKKTFLEELNTVFPRFALNLFLVSAIVCFLLFFGFYCDGHSHHASAVRCA